MARIDERFLDCSVYLYRTSEEASQGDRSGGSGFLVAVPGYGNGWLLEGRCPQDDFHHLYAVSNRHVIEIAPVVRLNKRDGGSEVIQFQSDDWVYTVDQDVAVVPINYDTGYKYRFIVNEDFLTRQQMKEYDVGIGDDVLMVGRFISHDGKQVNSPTTRY